MPFDFNTDTISQNTRLYAKWIEEEFTVSFYTDGGDEIISNHKYRKGDLLIRPKDPKKNGFIFGGWFKDAPLTMPFDFAVDTVDINIKLYAKWLPVSSEGDNAVGKDSNTVSTSDETSGTIYVVLIVIAGIFIVKLAKRKSKVN